jgi:pyruvate,water dikinase
MNIIPFSNITLRDLPEVGGKNSSLGEMFNRLKDLNIGVPDGFAVTASAYRKFLEHNRLEEKLKVLLAKADPNDPVKLAQTGSSCRRLIMDGTMPGSLEKEILDHFKLLKDKYSEAITVAVRSSATAEDLPNASFAGQHDSFLNVDENDVLNKCIACFASLFNDRAIKYRMQMGFDHMKISLSVGIQKMVRSDLASAGVAFTIEPETGFENFIYITGVWGLGENIVQGTVTPDEFYVFKPSLKKDLTALVSKKCGAKEETMVFAENKSHTVNIRTSEAKRETFVLSNEEVSQLGKWCLGIEEHYKTPMDIEWAKDGTDGKLYIVQARPETIHHGKARNTIKEYRLKEKGKAILSGRAVGNKIVTGIARIIHDPKEGYKLMEGEILVTDTTSPDWNAVLKKAAVIITNKGGRTSHASIVARELGLSAVVGTINATELIKDGDLVTVSCAEGETGKIYSGKLSWEETEIRTDNIRMPHTKPMLILADPSRALEASFYPNMGVGLLRMEFIINNSVQVHPMALVNFDSLKDENEKNKIAQLTKGYQLKTDYFTDRLSQGIGMIAAAFYPKEVIVRMSDFKTNEYSDLLGGKAFEPSEENPMIGFRGASRYYNERYKKGFRLECEAIRIVREKMGLTNVKLMIPFCRTVDEGKKVIQAMKEFDLERGTNGLEIYVMAEIPSNVIQAEEFAEVFDGFSIGSNDLTQLTLGIDRDSEIVSDLFSEKNPSAMWMISTVIKKAKRSGAKIGLCGQAPSDYPDFAKFLVEQGIDSISFNLDALLNGIENINKAEIALKQKIHS